MYFRLFTCFIKVLVLDIFWNIYNQKLCDVYRAGTFLPLSLEHINKSSFRPYGSFLQLLNILFDTICVEKVVPTKLSRVSKCQVLWHTYADLFSFNRGFAASIKTSQICVECLFASSNDSKVSGTELWVKFHPTSGMILLIILAVSHDSGLATTAKWGEYYTWLGQAL